MTDALHFELCPETGICSIVRGGTEKIDLMPDEVAAIRDAAGDPKSILAVLADNDDAFTSALTPAELQQIENQLAR